MSRYYVVKHREGAERLIEADHPAQAIRHVAEGEYSARPATPRDVARVMESGGKVEAVPKYAQQSIEGVLA